MLRRALLLLAVSVAAVSVQAWRVPPMNVAGEGFDHFFYRAMAANTPTVTRPEWDRVHPGTSMAMVYASEPGSLVLSADNPLRLQPPYCYRVLTPALVGLTMAAGFSVYQGFYAVTVIGLILAGVAMGLIVVRRGPLWCGALAVLAFATYGPITAVNLKDYALVDPLMFAALAWGIYLLLVDGARWPFFVVVVAGVLDKEIVAALLPCAVVYEWCRAGAFPWRTAAVAACILSAYAAFRWSIPIPVDKYSPMAVFEGVPGHVASDLWGLFGALGLTVVRVWRTRDGIAMLPLLAAIAVATLFANDQVRVYTVAFPALAVFAATSATVLSVAAPFMLLPLQRVFGFGWMWLAPAIAVELYDAIKASRKR